jgi:hypothetical protein
MVLGYIVLLFLGILLYTLSTKSNLENTYWLDQQDARIEGLFCKLENRVALHHGEVRNIKIICKHLLGEKITAEEFMHCGQFLGFDNPELAALYSLKNNE